MCDKRRASDSGSPSTSTKRFKETTNCLHFSTTTINIDENSSTMNDNERLQPVNDFDSIFAEAEPTSLQYNGKIPLQPEELLLYCLTDVVFPSKSHFPVQPKQYYYLSRAVYIVYGVRFDCKGIQNYFYRSINNLSKGLGKFDGHLRWKFYLNSIQKIVTKQQSFLLKLLDSEMCDILNCDELKMAIENECLACLQESKQSNTLAYRVSKDMVNTASKFPKWKVIPNVPQANVHLYYHGKSPVKIDYEVVINANGSYQFFHMGKPRTMHIDPDILPPIVHERKQLHLLMKSLEKFKICPGLSTENYLSILPDSLSTPIFNTSDGKPGAFVEVNPINVQEQVIRSTKCAILHLDQENTCCKACNDTNHYLRTLKSRRSQQLDSTISKYKRYDYMSRNELIDHSRESAKKLHTMQVQTKRLEQHQQNMSTVGSNTDSEFRQLFQELYSGIRNKMEKHDNKIIMLLG
jgi:hypothetical protein